MLVLGAVGGLIGYSVVSSKALGAVGGAGLGLGLGWFLAGDACSSRAASPEVALPAAPSQQALPKAAPTTSGGSPVLYQATQATQTTSQPAQSAVQPAQPAQAPVQTVVEASAVPPVSTEPEKVSLLDKVKTALKVTAPPPEPELPTLRRIAPHFPSGAGGPGRAGPLYRLGHQPHLVGYNLGSVGVDN